MEDPSCYLHVHGGKFALVPYSREDDKPFTVYEAVEIFSTRVSNETLGKAILSSFQKSRTNVSSNDEGLSLEDIAKLFGRTADLVWLGVWEKNEKAIQFYGKNGFEVFDHHVFMLGGDRQIDIMMKKAIPY